MGYLYKLVDKKSFDTAKDGIINFNHPFITFGKWEGKFIEFGHSIYERFLKEGLNIKPTKEDLKNIDTWVNAFKSVIPNVSDFNINSDSKLLFYQQITRFCGYFTRENLFDENILREYLSKNSFKDKVAVIRINDKIFDDYWFEASTNEILGPYTKIDNKNNSSSGFKGITHIIEVTYTNDVNDYEKYIKLVWQNEKYFDVSSLFRYLPIDYKNEKETRITFQLNGFREFNSCIAADDIYSRPCNTLSEELFNDLINVFNCVISINNLERIYIKLDKNDIQYKEI